MKLYARLVVALGFPIAAACTLSLPLILLGAVARHPRPWNWPTVYIVDFLYGLALFSQLVGFLCRTSRNRLWTAAVGGYTALGLRSGRTGGAARPARACSQLPSPQNGSFSSSCPPG